MPICVLQVRVWHWPPSFTAQHLWRRVRRPYGYHQLVRRPPHLHEQHQQVRYCAVRVRILDLPGIQMVKVWLDGKCLVFKPESDYQELFHSNTGDSSPVFSNWSRLKMHKEALKWDLDKSLNCPPAGGWQPCWGPPVCVLLSGWDQTYANRVE